MMLQMSESLRRRQVWRCSAGSAAFCEATSAAGATSGDGHDQQLWHSQPHVGEGVWFLDCHGWRRCRNPHRERASSQTEAFGPHMLMQTPNEQLGGEKFISPAVSNCATHTRRKL